MYYDTIIIHKNNNFLSIKEFNLKGIVFFKIYSSVKKAILLSNCPVKNSVLLIKYSEVVSL